MYRPVSPRNGSRPPPRGRGPLPRSVTDRFGMVGYGAGNRPVRCRPLGFGGRGVSGNRHRHGDRYLAASRGKRKWTAKSASRGETSEATGTVPRRAGRCPGGPARALRAEGEFGSQRSADRWACVREGKFGNGTFRLAGRGDGGNGTAIEGKMEGIEIAQLFSLLAAKNPGKRGGPSTPGFAARSGPMGWEVPRFTAGTEELSVGRRACRASAWKDASVRPTGRSPSALHRPRCGSTER